MLITVTMILIIVTTIPTIPTTVPSIFCSFHIIFRLYHLQNTTVGSSQNVLILAKGEPLIVLAAPINYDTRNLVVCEYRLKGNIILGVFFALEYQIETMNDQKFSFR